MKIKGKSAKVFRIRNRKGYACIASAYLTEGKTPRQAVARMEKALKRKPKQ